MSASPGDLRPELVFRVGVTGHRGLPPEALEDLRAAVRQCFVEAAGVLEDFATRPEARAVYRRSDGGALFRLKMISPLASGADRLVAKEALDLGAELDTPLPFAASEYAKDFPETAAVFAEYLQGARAFTLDGARDGGPRQAESYEAVGQFVVRNSDLVIALWDGEPAKGRGGTGDIVRFAIRVGVPVWWVDARRVAPPRLLTDSLHLSASETAPVGSEAIDRLRRYLRAEILPPPWTPPPPENAFDWIAEGLRRLTTAATPPLQAFYSGEGPRRQGFWRLHAAALKLFRSRSGAKAPQRPAAESPLELYWRARFEAADHISGACADRYRTSYVVVAIFAFAALACATAAFERPSVTQNALLTGGEVVAILSIAALVIANRAYRWHERWISCRLLAEVCRAQYALSGLGRALPGRAVARLAFDVDKEEAAPHETWVAFAYMALLRGAPFPEGEMRAAKRRAVEVGRSLIAEQIGYHEKRLDSTQRAERWLTRVASAAFFAVLVFAVVKLAILVGGSTDYAKQLQFLGALLSAAAGALVGVRAYAEFSLLSRQSSFMTRVLKAAGGELEAAARIVDDPLSSAPLTRALSDVTAAMLQDITGWAHLFRIKSLEAS